MILKERPPKMGHNLETVRNENLKGIRIWEPNEKAESKKIKKKVRKWEPIFHSVSFLANLQSGQSTSDDDD